MRLFFTSALIIISVTAAKAQDVEVYKEMCDASAVSFISDNRFVVANDEKNSLRIYDRRNPNPVAKLKIRGFLKIKKGEESDIEGATRIGKQIFWITSHGANRDGEIESSRRHLFATEIFKDGTEFKIRLVGKSYINLVDDLISKASLDEQIMLSLVQSLPPKKGGFNIEGLATSPTGGLLIALRSPAPKGRSVIIELENPDEVIDKNNKGVARFSKPQFLKLGDGIGIRAIEQAEELGSYFIVSGPVGPEPDMFRLHRWNMSSGVIQPVEVDLGSLLPEGIAKLPSTSKKLIIVSDDGSRKINGKDCKDNGKSNREFRLIEATVSK